VKRKSIVIGSLLLSVLSVRAKNYSVFTEGLIKDITPKGWLKEYLQRMKEGMTGHPEALSYPYNTCLWAGDIPRNGDYGQDWWRYEQTAYYTDGLLRLGYLLKDEELIKKGEEGIQYTLSHPQSNGRLGNGVISSLWPQAVFFRALKAYYEVTGDRKVRTALASNYNSMNNNDLTNGRRHIVNLEGMLWLYGQQAQSALLTKAKTAYKTGGFELDGKEASEDDFIYMHGVTYSEMLKIPMILYAYTGEKTYLDLALNAERRLERDHLLPDGVPSSEEYTVGKDIDQVHETCDIVDYTWSLGYFLTTTGEAEWADRIERAVFNAGPACHTKDFRSLQYFSGLNQILCTGNSDNTYFKRGSTWQAYRPTHETECCAGNIHRLMPNFASRMWLRGEGNAIVAAMYSPSEVAFKIGTDSIYIKEDTYYPFSGHIDFRFSMKNATEFPFIFRIPGWCTNCHVMINGEDIRMNTTPHTFTTLERMFHNGDVVSVDFEMQPQIVTLDAEQGQYVECGPLLYSYAIPQTMTEDTKVYSNMAGKVSENPDFKCWSITPSGKWNYGMKEGKQNLRLVTDESLLANTYPFDKETTPVSIEVDVTPVRWTILDNRYNPVTPCTNTTVVNGSQQRIRLIPYGCTELRVTVFPTLTSSSEKTLTEKLIVNPDFELTSATTINHGGVEKKSYLPYGWKVRGTLSGSSYGINRDAVNHHGENVCWYNTIPFPANFQLYQTIPASKLKAGTYRVTCQLWCANNKKGVTRLFANNNVQYFGHESDYVNCFTEGEDATFAGHAGDTGGSPFILKDMEVTVHVAAGETLTIGIRSSNMKNDGTLISSADGTGWFKVDNFQIELIEDDETAINTLLPTRNERERWYSLNGICLSRKPSHSIYIYNGKKIATN
jgi:hypothetical protein